VAQWRERWHAATDASWAVTSAPDVVQGSAALRDVDLARGCAEVGYWVVHGSRGQGIAARAAGELSRWALEELGLHRLEIRHSVANPSSCIVALKIGFVLEGTMRAESQHRDGWHDMHLHACIRSGG
jgi:RimJ/RimL family protein N-acetyltransferase